MVRGGSNHLESVPIPGISVKSLNNSNHGYTSYYLIIGHDMMTNTQIARTESSMFGRLNKI